MLDANGKLVTYEQIQAQVWQDVVVAPNALQRIITQLRKAFDDTAKHQSIIRTHPKRGYSMVREAASDEVPLDDEATVKNKKSAWFYCCLAGFICLLLVGFWRFTEHDEIALGNAKVMSLDTQTEQFSQIIAISKNEMLFIDNAAGNKFVRHNTSTNQRDVLINDVPIYGRMVFDELSHQVLFGQITTLDGVKCAELMQFDINNQQLRQLLPCKDTFNHTPMRLNESKLIFVRTNKQWQSALVLLDQQNDTAVQLFTGDFQSAILSPSKEFVALKYKNKVAVLNIKEVDNRKLESTIVTSSEGISAVTFNNKSNLLIAYDNTLFEYSVHGELVTQSMLNTSMQVAELTYANEQLIALLGRDNHQVRRSSVQKSNDVVDVAPSKFTDKQGRFRPNSHDISLLSNRSGRAQIWLQHGENLKQITHADAVQDHIWIDKNNFAYLSGGDVWILSMSGNTNKVQKLKDLLNVTALIQANNGTLYVQTSQQGLSKLLAVDIADGTTKERYVGAFHWAQIFKNHTLLINEHSRLNKRIAKNPNTIKALPSLVLQGRYYKKDEQAYIQDKKRNIWQYDPVLEKAKIIGHYNQQTLFMSDFSSQSLQMLSDNFVETNNELVLVNFEYQPF